MVAPELAPYEGVDMLALLPAPVLANSVLPLLGPEALVRLGACSRTLRAAAFADEAWKPLCEARGWGPFPRGVRWQAGFSSRRASLCVECGQPSAYVFRLLSCRLCEACEHKNPRYGLVTAMEASDRYGVSLAALKTLPYHDTCRSRFYLRTAVEALAAQAAAARQRGFGVVSCGSSGESGGEDEEAEEAGGQGAEEEEREEGAESSEEEEEEGAGRGGPRKGGGRGGDKEQDKAARKAAKKAAKEAQRLKRAQKSYDMGPGPSTGPLRPSYGAITTGTSPPPGGYMQAAVGGRRGGGGRGTPQAAGAALLGSSPPGGGRRGRRGGAAGAVPARTPPGCRPTGPPVLLFGVDGDALPLEGQAVQLGGGGGGVRARGGGGGGAGGVTRHAHGAKLKSGWAAEREALMAEWGQFGISGLVLAS